VGDATFDVMDWVFWARAFAALLAAIRAARGEVSDAVEALLAIAP